MVMTGGEFGDGRCGGGGEVSERGREGRRVGLVQCLVLSG